MAQHEPLTSEQVVAFVADALNAAYYLGEKGDKTEQATNVTTTTRLLADWITTSHAEAMRATIDEVAARANDHLAGMVIARTATEVATALGCDNRVELRRLGPNYIIEVVTADGQPVQIPIMVEAAPDDASSIIDPPEG